MFSTLKQRLHDEDEGFTLIELMVVVLIIAILIAIAIPTFLGAQDRARDRGTQSDLRNALTAAKTIATDDAGQFTNVDTASLASAESALSFGAAGTTDTVGVVDGGAAEPDQVLLYKQSPSDAWFGISTNSAGDVTKCKGEEADVDTYAACVTTAGGTEGDSNW